MNAKAIPVTRGCGTRVRGGLYAESGMSPFGSPVEAFLCDPPLILDFARLGVIPRGTHLVELKGVTHVFDWVGSNHYPNVADFVEEVRRFGVSRRLSPQLDFSKLTPESRLFLVHARAYASNFADYTKEWRYTREANEAHPFPRCPKERLDHDQESPPSCCVGMYWQDIEGGASTGSDDVRAVEVKMPAFSYNAFARPEGLKPVYVPAVFGVFPISRLVAVAQDSEKDGKNMETLGKSQIPSELEDE
jgi:hypothetical protein